MSFPVSLCNEVVRGLDFRTQCTFARAVGYNGLELAPFTLGAVPHSLPPADIRRIRSIADGEGMTIAGLHWLLAVPDGLSITSTNEGTYRRTVDVGRRLVGLCSELGGRYLVHGSPTQRQLPAGHEADGRERANAYFAAMAEASVAAGVTYCLEPLSCQDTAFINTVEEAVAIIDAVGSPGLATMLDCYAAASDGHDIPDLLRRWIPAGVISHIHFNDTNRRGPGEGTLRFGPVVDALVELGYAGTAAVEPFVYEPDGPACAARAIGYLRGLLEAHR